MERATLLTSTRAGIAALALSGCVTAGGHPELALRNLLIDDGSGPVPYLGVVGKLPKPEWHMKGLPMGDRVWLGNLTGPEVKWLHAYDFDGDDHLSRGEFTQGWLVKTAQLITGKDYAPDALKAYPATASLLAQTPAPQSLKGLEISVAEEKGVRGKLDAIGSETGNASLGQAVEAVVSSVSESLSSTVAGGEGGGGEEGGAGGGEGGGGAGGGAGDGD